MQYTTLEAIAKECIAIQDASNLRGVLKTWHELLCSEPVVRGGQVEEYINVLMLSKMTALLEANCDGIGDVIVHSYGPDKEHTETYFTDAYKWARRIATDES